MNFPSHLLSASRASFSILRSPQQRCVVLGHSPTSLPSRCHARPFSQSPGRAKMRQAKQMSKPKAPPALSMKNQVKQAMSKSVGSEGEDMGLLPGTFIRPMMKNMPSLFKDYKARWLMEWTSLKAWFQGTASVVMYCKMVNKKMPLRFWERKSTAVDLHKKMYQAFAAGDVDTLRQICCPSLAQDFESRISRRPPHSRKLTWTLHQYQGLTMGTVVSDRAGQVPDAEGMGLRQTVVRIRSKQSLKKPSPNARAPSSSSAEVQGQVRGQKQDEGLEKVQECTEYVLIQRFMVNHVDRDWKVWGLVDETTQKQVETDPSFAPGLSIKDRLMPHLPQR